MFKSERKVVSASATLGILLLSVAVAVSCPHHVEAFEACRHAIDRSKELAPICKKENWADGSTEWVHPGASR